MDRVVGPEELHEQDDELRDQLSRLQISSELCGNYMCMCKICAVTCSNCVVYVVQLYSQTIIRSYHVYTGTHSTCPYHPVQHSSA